jgi:hypothetical protein
MHSEAQSLGLLNHRLLGRYTDPLPLLRTILDFGSRRVLPAAFPVKLPEEGGLHVMPARPAPQGPWALPCPSP